MLKLLPGSPAGNLLMRLLSTSTWAEGTFSRRSRGAPPESGTRAGYDLEMVRAVRAAVAVPLIASGGAGALTDFAPAVDAGADAVLAASVFHFGLLRIGQVKHELAAGGHPVR